MHRSTTLNQQSCLTPKSLRTLRRRHPQEFVRIWQLLSRGWAHKVQQLARVQSFDDAERRSVAVMAVLEHARCLAQDIGAQDERTVVESLLQLHALCTEAVVQGCDSS